MSSKYVKIIVTVPVVNADVLRNAIGQAGGGKIGNYAFCSFSTIGVGRFLPNENANPTIGTAGSLEQVNEERIEFNCARDILTEVLQAIRDSHPYEEVALDIISLEDAP